MLIGGLDASTLDGSHRANATARLGRRQHGSVAAPAHADMNFLGRAQFGYTQPEILNDRRDRDRDHHLPFGRRIPKVFLVGRLNQHPLAIRS